jgi:hypothetical protein
VEPFQAVSLGNGLFLVAKKSASLSHNLFFEILNRCVAPPLHSSKIIIYILTLRIALHHTTIKMAMRSEQSRDRSDTFMSYLAKRVEEKRPELLAELKRIVELHRQQEPGYKNSSTVLHQLNDLVGEEFYGQVYYKFIDAWKAHLHVQNAGRKADFAQHRRLEQRTHPQRQMIRPEGIKSMSAGTSAHVIDLTGGAEDGERGGDSSILKVVPPPAAAAASSGKNASTNEHPLTMPSLPTPYKKDFLRESLSPSRTAQQTAASRRMSLPTHSRSCGSTSGPKKDVPFMASLEPPPGQPRYPFSSGTPLRSTSPHRSATKATPPRAADASGGRHFSLLSQMQRRIKDDTSTSVVFVHNTLSSLQRENPFLYQQALSIIEECLGRNSNRETGYEFVANAIHQRLKALVLLGDSSVINAANFYDLTNRTGERQRTQSHLQQRPAAMASPIVGKVMHPPLLPDSPREKKKDDTAEDRSAQNPTGKHRDKSKDMSDGETQLHEPQSPLDYSSSSSLEERRRQFKPRRSIDYLSSSSSRRSPSPSPSPPQRRPSIENDQSEQPSRSRFFQTPELARLSVRDRNPTPTSPSSTSYDSAPTPQHMGEREQASRERALKSTDADSERSYRPLLPPKRNSNFPSKAPSNGRNKRPFSSSSSSGDSGSDGFCTSSDRSISSIEYTKSDDVRSRSQIAFKRRKVILPRKRSNAEAQELPTAVTVRKEQETQKKAPSPISEKNQAVDDTKPPAASSDDAAANHLEAGEETDSESDLVV